MAKINKQPQKELYHLYEIAEITGKSENHILDLAAKGLTFSMHVPYVGLELHQCEKHIEDVINGHEVFDVEVTKREFKEYTHETFDLFSSTPVSFARGKIEVEPDFHIQGWQRAIIRGRDKIYATKDNIFVTAANIDAYGKLNKEFGDAFKKRQKQKPGPKSPKLESAIQKMLDEIESGKETLETLTNMTQESLELQYDVSRVTAKNAREEVIAKLNCQN